jgi:hypothetical protein
VTKRRRLLLVIIIAFAIVLSLVAIGWLFYASVGAD